MYSPMTTHVVNLAALLGDIDRSHLLIRDGVRTVRRRHYGWCCWLQYDDDEEYDW